MCSSDNISTATDRKTVSQLPTKKTASARPQHAASSAVSDLVVFYQCLWFYIVQGGNFSECPYLKGRRQARCQVYSLALIMELWDKPHYRNGTFRDDMLKNLRNVAVPGTGIALSWFCYFRVTALCFILFAYPLICLAAALKAGDFCFEKVCLAFSQQLLEPQDWFSFWRLNCRLASLHALVTKEQGYKYEDKWTFLTDGQEKGVPVSPWLDVSKLFVKHRNEEGGLGCAAYKNATDGGDWIIQECLQNGPDVACMLPDNAPLSTFRVITASRGGLSTVSADSPNLVSSLSCVFRAGRANAMTDHESILFDVNTTTGEVKKGTTNEHWYRLGLDKITNTQWTSTHDVVNHPDTGRAVAGNFIHNIREVLQVAEDAHSKLCPGVPAIGWDVAVTTKGMFLLEGNFSCNFFRGHFDQAHYFKFIEEYFLDLELVKAAGPTKAVEVASPAAPAKASKQARPSFLGDGFDQREEL